MSIEADLAERFASATKRKGITPIELFEEYDRWDRGTITYEIFIKCLSSISFYIKKNELDIIKNEYCCNNLFEYKRFCQDIGPKGQLTLSRSIHLDQASQQDNIQKVAKEFKYSGLNIFDYLKGYDSNHDGKVSMAVFLQAVSGSPLIRSAIQPYYNKTTNEVNYLQFQRDIDQIECSEKVALDDQIKEPLPEVFNEFALNVHSRSINLRGPFVDHDMFKRGKIPQPTFLASIGQFGLQYSPYQLQQLMRPFITSDGNVNYILFCNEVDKLEPKKNSDVDYDLSSPLEPLLDFIKTEVKNRHIHLNEGLKGKMSKEDFYNVLLNYRIQLNSNDKQALNKAFQISENVIDADGFIEKVDPLIQMQATTVELVTERLRKHLENTNQSLLQHILYYDREHSKVITLIQFRSALNSIQFNATSHEIVQLAKQFGDGNSVIFYENLCSLIESRPLDTETKDVFYQAVTPSKSGALDTLTKIHNIANEYHIDLRSEFQKSDPRKRGVLPLPLFKKALSLLPRFYVGSEEVCSLIENYTDFHTHNVYYNKFCDDLSSIGSTHSISPRPKTQKFSTTTSPIKTRSIDDEPEYFNLPKQSSFVDSIRDSILTTLKKCVAATTANRMTIGDLFSYHDTTKDGFVNTRDVKAILAPFDSFLEEQNYKEIIESFKDRRMPEKFAWRKFYSEVTDTKLTDEELNYFTKCARLKLGLYKNVCNICNCVRARLVSRRKRVDDLFFDCINDVIPEKEFRERLERSGFSLPENEMVSVIRHYQNEDFSGIRWKVFCDDVENSKPMA